MTVRNRSLSLDGSGTHQKVGTSAFGPDPVTWPSYRATSTDVADDYGGLHQLALSKTMREIECFNGDTRNNVSDANYMVYNNCAPAYYRSAAFDHIYISSMSSDSVYATRTIARTNPSRPHVDLPVSLVELRELPSLLHLAGKTLLRKGSSAFLSYQYGWKPLIKDVGSVVDFSAAFKKRMREVTKIAETGGVRYKRSLGSWQAGGTQGPLYISSDNGDLIQARSTINTHVDMWSTVRWSTAYNVSSMIKSGELERLVRDALYGRTADLKTTWNLIPWSWLMDWYSTMGDFLEATRQVLPYTPSSCCVMKHITTSHNWTTTNYKGTFPFLSGGNARILLDYKYRAAGLGATVTADVPIINTRQASILGALGIQRVPRGILR